MDAERGSIDTLGTRFGRRLSSRRNPLPRVVQTIVFLIAVGSLFHVFGLRASENFTVVTRAKTASSAQLSSPTPLTRNPNDVNPKEHLSHFLKRQSITNESTLLVTFSNIQYIPAVRNFREVLKKSGRKEPLLVICLDVDSAIETKRVGLIGYDKFIHEGAAQRNMVASTKWSITLDLLTSGYNIIVFDADVFLNPGRDIFEGMLGLDDPSWDVLFQDDGTGSGSNDHGFSALNFGWFWAKPSSAAFFRECFERWQLSKMWDQQVLNEVVTAEIQEVYHHLRTQGMDDSSINQATIAELLPYKYLSLTTHMNWMLTPWYYAYGNITSIAEFIEPSVIIHFTCMETVLKVYFAKHYGLWTDIDQYYSRPVGLIEMPEVTGSPATLARSMGVMIELGRRTNRKIILPYFANGIATDAVQAERRRATETWHLPSIEEFIVESTYVANRANQRFGTMTKQVVNGIHIADLTKTVKRFPLNQAASLSAATLALLVATSLSSDEEGLDAALCSTWKLEVQSCLEMCGDGVDPW